MKILRILFASVLIFSAYSQEQVKYNGNGNYIYIERTDLRRYDNGKYTGLTSREVKSYITQSRENGDRFYDGYFYVAEDTVHKMQSVGTVLNDAISSKFKITSSGELVMIEDNGYPTFRSFPTFPGQKIKKGDKWQAKAERTVDPLNKNVYTKMPIQVEYTYLRDEQYRGEEVFVFSAEWATRYGITYWDFGGDRNLKSANGSNKATMYVSKKTGNALVVRDSVDETFEYNDGTKVSFKGTISLFTEYPPAFDRTKLYPALNRIADNTIGGSDIQKPVNEIKDLEISDETKKEISNKISSSANGSLSEKPHVSSSNKAGGTSASGKNSVSNKSGGAASASKNSGSKNSSGKNQTEASVQKKNPAGSRKSSIENSVSAGSSGKSEKKNEITVKETDAGIMLTIQNLKFKPDSAELLPGENERITKIAEVLKQAKDQMILVEGHTASTGNVKGEQQLSVERANAIKDALVKCGVSKDKFICKGHGGTKPVADNSTPEGKAKNRRVEITILD